jgi:type III restriction enzyme
VTTNVSADELFDEALIQQIASSLDLREPNKEALESIVFEVVQHFEVDGKPPPFEAVVDSATGVGKTYIIAAALDFFAAKGVRNFAVIAPGSTILKKTIANFTAGHAKSLLGGMNVRPVVITAENFATAAMRAVMADDQAVKLFIFTVQALLNPQTKTSRKTRKFRVAAGHRGPDGLCGRASCLLRRRILARGPRAAPAGAHRTDRDSSRTHPRRANHLPVSARGRYRG